MRARNRNQQALLKDRGMTTGRTKCAGLVLALVVATSTAEGQEPAVVAVLTAIQHPNLDAVRDGLRDALRDRGYIDGENLVLVYESAQADPETAARIARAFAARQPDVAVAISAPAAEALVPMGEKLPVVITALGSGKAAEIVDGNISIAGLVQPPPHRQQLDLVEAIAPGTTRLIVPYSATAGALNANSEEFRRSAGERGLKIIPVAISEEGDIAAQVRPYFDEKAAIFLLRDPGIDEAIELLVELAISQGVPIFASSEEAVARGALATIAYDPYDVGRQTGVQVLEILAGKSPAALGLTAARPTRVVLNEDTAERIGLQLPADLRNRARFIVEGPFDRPARGGIPRPVPPPCDGTARCE